MLRTRHSPQQCLLWKHDMPPCATAPWQRVSVLFSLPRQKFGDSDVDMAKCGIGFTCRKGLKPESPNQDCHGSYSIYLPGGQDASNVARIYTQACGVRLVFGTMSSRGIPSIQLLDSYARSILLRLRFMMTKICNQKTGGKIWICQRTLGSYSRWTASLSMEFLMVMVRRAMMSPTLRWTCCRSASLKTNVVSPQGIGAPFWSRLSRRPRTSSPFPIKEKQFKLRCLVLLPQSGP